MLKNKAGYVYFYAEDTNSGLLKTGATITVKISKDGGAATASTNSVSEVETGVYKVLLTAAETNADVIAFLPSTVTTYTKVYPAFIETQNVSKELPEELTSAHQTANTIGKAISDTLTITTDIQTKTNSLTTELAKVVGKLPTGNIMAEGGTANLIKINGTAVTLSQIQSLTSTQGEQLSNALMYAKAMVKNRMKVNDLDSSVIDFYDDDNTTVLFSVQVSDTERTIHA